MGPLPAPSLNNNANSNNEPHSEAPTCIISSNAQSSSVGSSRLCELLPGPEVKLFNLSVL